MDNNYNTTNFDQSQQMQTIWWTNQYSREIHAIIVKREKAYDWFWFELLLVEKVVQMFFNTQMIVTVAAGIRFANKVLRRAFSVAGYFLSWGRWLAIFFFFFKIKQPRLDSWPTPLPPSTVVQWSVPNSNWFYC